ncbi:MAG: sigma-54-dependent Fis family transcriptional regulator [Alphaproteobacteria bacterium]|nr:MAG: sigma-54-dependent Fis family transcriptional regulator [Alphaproteobacteria bacterium]TAF14911.1 MAG: sigma-54-dependent Fis family transcriptional regulator [Alphaproteobacteria bacterium]TAF77189.1 MAG: sigma-54-dependent Fis family transcriptional regulator [Alphaproteobacteria bacterium]
MFNDILVVDDEADIRNLISEILVDEGLSVRTAKNSDLALRSLAERVPSLMILDIWLQGSELDGLGILELCQERYPSLPVIMISGHGNIETAVNSIKMGAFDFIEKPFEADHLLHAVNKASELSRLRRENEELKLRGKIENTLLGKSPAICQVRSIIEKVAPTNSRVLITGEEGTGKEVVARLLHENSARNQAPFIMLNSASLHPSQVDAELFGMESTSPGGGAESLGLFERAHGGTLFIDEIADMSRETQGKVLKALHEQSFERVGGTKRVSVDVRVIAATNRDLKREMERGNFREDLYYRLSVVPIHMPALRERREDIPELCEFFMRASAKSAGISMRDIAAEAMAVLQAYHWPGNIRHLRNVIEWMLIMSTGRSTQVLDEMMLPPELRAQNGAVSAQDDGNAIMAMPLREAREVFEKQYLMTQIARFGGNISKTASFIGMERSALHRKLKLLGIHNDEKILA